jgi:hypothetical protein
MTGTAYPSRCHISETRDPDQVLGFPIMGLLMPCLSSVLTPCGARGARVSGGPFLLKNGAISLMGRSMCVG